MFKHIGRKLSDIELAEYMSKHMYSAYCINTTVKTERIYINHSTTYRTEYVKICSDCHTIDFIRNMVKVISWDFLKAPLAASYVNEHGQRVCINHFCVIVTMEQYNAIVDYYSEYPVSMLDTAKYIEKEHGIDITIALYDRQFHVSMEFKKFHDTFGQDIKYIAKDRCNVYTIEDFCKMVAKVYNSKDTKWIL